MNNRMTRPGIGGNLEKKLASLTPIQRRYVLAMILGKRGCPGVQSFPPPRQV